METGEKTEKRQTQTNTKKDVSFNVEICSICGSKLLRRNKKRHYETKKHNEAHYIHHDRFEIR